MQWKVETIPNVVRDVTSNVVPVVSRISSVLAHSLVRLPSLLILDIQYPLT